MSYLRTLALCLLSTLSLAQARGSREPPPPATMNQSPLPEPDETREHLAREMARKANIERQAQLKSDTDKLLKLATELKDSVEKSSENTLSLSVVRKAEEIEKLARSVKEKMKGQN